MREKIFTILFWTAVVLILGWVFDTGMKKQHEIDCAQGRYCDDV